jgi:Mrp family chromosome partitioning ATPase/capsular polysaccharide biosynthesis protein
MTVQPTDSPLRQYLQILRRQWWLLVFVPAIAIAATLFVLGVQKPVYRASTTLVVGEPRGTAPPVLGSFGLTRTMTTLLRSDLVARSVIANRGLDLSPGDFLKKLKVDVLPDSSVLDVSYTSSNERQALGVVREIARIFTRELDDTLGVHAGATGPTDSRETTGSAATDSSQSFDLIVRVFDPPHVAEQPRAQTSYVVFAALGGAALGLLLAIGREALSSPIQRRKEAEEWFGAPVVGTLPKVERKPPPGVGGRRGRGADAARVASLDLLRARLEFAQIGVAGPTILVTSAGSEAQTSPVAASLGAALTWAGNRVVCVDADVRSPSLHRSLGLQPSGPGLVGVLESGASLEEALVPVELVQPAANGAGPSKPAGRLELLPAGGPPSTLVGVLTTDAIIRLKERLHSRADFVVFDCPSLLVADALPLALQSDNVLVVARRGRTTKDQAESVRETLEGLGVHKVGVVLTDMAPGDGYA